MEKQKKLAILNLTGEFCTELAEYFKVRDIIVVDPLVSSEEMVWTHIITRDIHDFSLINKTYDLINKDRKVISLSKLNDLQNFVLNNGNLILDDIWFKTEMGNFILDKYFQGYGGINPSDNYPSFKEVGSFNVTNPFNIGEAIDRLVHSAFEEGTSAFAIKSYFDHLIMYVAGLKKIGKAGLPLEVTYGTYNDIFGVQLHFFCKTLDLFDVTTALSSGITKNVEEYALNVAVQSSDFFDFSYMPEVSKVIITGLWTKNERIKFENRGMMLTSLLGGLTIAQYNPEDVTSNLASMIDIKDNTENVVVSESLPDDVLEKTTIKGLTLNKETVEMVKGGIDTSDEARLVNGDKALEEFVNLVKGKFEDDKSIIRVAGDQLDLDQTVQRLAATIDESAKDSDLKIRSLNEKINESIKTGLLDFAKNMAKPVESLSDIDLDQFQLICLPGIIKETIINEIHESDVTSLITGEETSDEPQLIKGLGELEQLISIVKGRFEDDKEIIRLPSQKLDIDKTAFRIAATIDESTLESNLKVRSLGNKLPENIKTGLYDFAKGLNKHVEDLSNNDLDLFQDQRLPSIIKEGLLTQKLLATDLPVSEEQVSPIAKVLEGKLMKSAHEIERLKKENKNLYSEVRILKDSRSQMLEVQKKAVEASADQVDSSVPDQDDELRRHFQQKLEDQQILNELELKKLAGLLERESRLIADIKNEEMKSKRLQIEALQKENFFAQEIEKTQRHSKAKDIILIKSKETFTKLVDKKEREIADLKTKLDMLGKAIAGGSGQNQGVMLRELERQNQNLGKQIEVYKAKISSIAANLQAKKDDGASKDEIRKFQMQNNQMKNQVEYTKKELLKLTEKSVQDSSLIKGLKQEKVKLEQLVKSVSDSAITNMDEKLPSTMPVPTDQELKRMQAETQILENQLRDANLKITALEANLKDALKPQKHTGSEDGSKVKLSQLENSVKKLTQDLVESRNQISESKKDTNKLRQEKTALQNQLDKLKKEVDKVKAASPKKPGGRAA